MRKPAAVAPNPRVLVLLAAYNGQEWIGQQIDTVLAQEGVDVAVVVSDDASTDGTPAIVRNAEAADPRVRGIRQRTGSGSAAGNFIRLFAEVDSRRFTHVALCDQDDRWFPAKLRRACIRLDAAGADLCSAATLARWPDGRTAVLRQSDRTTPADFLFEGAGQGCTFVLTAALFTRVQEFVRASGGSLTSIHYHDWLVYALARMWSFAWVHDPIPCLEYRQHAQNDTGARTGVAGRGRRLALIRSGWYANQVRSMIEVCRSAGSQPEVERVHRLMSAASTSPASRWRWAVYLLRGGRRRLVDRIVLFVAACAGHL